jgi:anti-sigma factor RsiW
LADSEHVEVLRRGPRLWNDWRRQNPATVPNLIRLSLSAAERQMGIMNGGPVNLVSARLRGASLPSPRFPVRTSPAPTFQAPI